MARLALHQFIVGATPGDAITDHALLLRQWLQEDGIPSSLFAESIHPSLAKQVKSYLTYRPRQSGEIVILHHSIGSALVEHLLSLNVRFLLIYHNVTPAEFFTIADPVLTQQLELGRSQLGRLKTRAVYGLGISHYDERELREAGFGPTGVLPIPLDEPAYTVESNPAVLQRYQTGGPSLLFVGRQVPNKRQEDLIKLLYLYRRIAPAARLFIVGSPWLAEYADWLTEFADTLGLSKAVVFTGHVSQRDLVTYYRLADVYVSMSEHEGFGKPLVESMYLGVPVLAYAAAAVPETMGGAGVIFHRKNYEALAEITDMLASKSDLRRRIVVRQRERACVFLAPHVYRLWQNLLQNVFGR